MEITVKEKYVIYATLIIFYLYFPSLESRMSGMCACSVTAFFSLTNRHRNIIIQKMAHAHMFFPYRNHRNLSDSAKSTHQSSQPKFNQTHHPKKKTIKHKEQEHACIAGKRCC
jgi:hypothetical protein